MKLTVYDCLRQFILYSRLGRTGPDFVDLHDSGRLDIVVETIVASLFLSHGIRKDTIFHALLYGPPNPPLHIRIDGSMLHDVRTDQQTWQRILKKILGRSSHPGIVVDRTSFEALVKSLATASEVYVLEEGGNSITNVEIGENPVFILGDHVGLPKKAEVFALRYGQKISLGKRPYLAATCITIINYILDTKRSD